MRGEREVSEKKDKRRLKRRRKVSAPASRNVHCDRRPDQTRPSEKRVLRMKQRGMVPHTAEVGITVPSLLAGIHAPVVPIGLGVTASGRRGERLRLHVIEGCVFPIGG